MLGAGVTTWDALGNTWDVVTAAQANPNIDWYSYNQGFNDDAQWLILALYKVSRFLWINEAPAHASLTDLRLQERAWPGFIFLPCEHALVTGSTSHI